MSRYLDPTNDYAFHRLFGREQNKPLLVSFLNSVLGLPEGKKIVDLAYENSNQTPHLPGFKYTIVDVRVRDQRGVSYIVEMQVAKESFFEKRALYYTAKVYTSQIKRGEDYPKLNQVIFLGILDFVALKNPHYVSHHVLLEKETGEHHLTDFQLTFVELPKFNKTETELETLEDKWLYFLKHADEEQQVPSTIQEKEILSAYEELEQALWTDRELFEYEHIGVSNRYVLEVQKFQYNEGKKEGIVEGITEGKAKRDKENVLRLHTKKGMNAEEIADFLDLPLELVKEILDK